VDLGAQGRPAQRPRADQSLESVDDLDPARLPTAHHRHELAVARQRMLHLAQRRRGTQTKRRQLLAQLGEPDRGDGRRDVVHGATLHKSTARVDVVRDIATKLFGCFISPFAQIKIRPGS
jgi:hypothetical protein